MLIFGQQIQYGANDVKNIKELMSKYHVIERLWCISPKDKQGLLHVIAPFDDVRWLTDLTEVIVMSWNDHIKKLFCSIPQFNFNLTRAFL